MEREGDDKDDKKEEEDKKKKSIAFKANIIIQEQGKVQERIK